MAKAKLPMRDRWVVFWDRLVRRRCEPIPLPMTAFEAGWAAALKETRAEARLAKKVSK